MPAQPEPTSPAAERGRTARSAVVSSYTARADPALVHLSPQYELGEERQDDLFIRPQPLRRELAALEHLREQLHFDSGECGTWYGPEHALRLCRDSTFLPVKDRGQIRFFCRTCGALRQEGIGPLDRAAGEAQLRIFDPERQLPLPFAGHHVPTLEGHVPSECQRGFHGQSCIHHAPTDSESWAKAVKTETCGLQRCSSSSTTNTLERARDAMNGTADTEEGQADLENRIGLRHFGSVPWGVVIWTIPEELRRQCHGAALAQFRKAASEMTLEVLRELVSDSGSQWYMPSWLHPCGEARPPPKTDAEAEAEPGEKVELYNPHENLIVPMACLDSSGRLRRARKMLPREWLGRDGWILRRWRERLVEIFGQWWNGASETPPTLVFHWQYREDLKGKIFSLKYFPRTFARWSGHPFVRARPRSLGLKHAKRREDLVSLIEQLHEVPLPEWGSCLPCYEDGRQGEIVFSNGDSAEEARESLLQRIQARRAELGLGPGGPLAAGPYLEHRRTMAGPAGAGVHRSTAPPTDGERLPAIPAVHPPSLVHLASPAPGATGGAAPRVEICGWETCPECGAEGRACGRCGSTGVVRARVVAAAAPVEPFTLAELGAFLGSTASGPLDARVWRNQETGECLPTAALSDGAEYQELPPRVARRLEQARQRERFASEVVGPVLGAAIWQLLQARGAGG